MALPTVKVAISNGHFRESLMNFGDRGTWSTVGGFSGGNTILTDTNANWVADEWIGYRIRVDVNDANTIATVVDNTENTITVSGDHSGLTAGTDTYRIGAGLKGTASASNSTTITLTSITNEWGTTIAPKEDELIGMTIVPDKLDGTGYAITDNSAVTTGSMTVTIGTAVTVSSTSFEIGRGASASVYPEAINISAELNEPKQLEAAVIYDVVGADKFEQETDIDNPLMLGSLARVTETTGNKILFEGHIQTAPTSINAETRAVQFTAYDKLAILDYTVIPATAISDTGTLPSYGFSDSTPLIESDIKGYGGDNKVYQTKAFEDYSYVSQPFGYAGSVNSNGTYNTRTSGGSTSGATLEPDSGTPFDTDLIKAGAVVINTTDKKITHIKSVTDNNTIVCTDAIWTSGDKYLILSKNWQVGEGIQSDADYTTNAGWSMNTVTRADLDAPSGSTAADDTSAGTTQVYVGRSSGTQDVPIPFAGRAWGMLVHTDYVELFHYSGYQEQDGKYYLYALNNIAQTARNTRGDLTNAWEVTSTSYKGRAWTSGAYLIEVFPNRFGVNPPNVYHKQYKPVAEIGVVASEGIIQMPQGDAKWDGHTSLYCHQYSYDGDASSSPDKGTSDDSLDISDVVRTAVTGLTDTSASNEDIISKSKMTGGAGLTFDTTNSKDTGIKINAFSYTAYGEGSTPIQPKQLIDKLCVDSGVIYDLRYDDNTNKVIFKPLAQKALASADITLSAGSVTSLTRERDVSDVYSAMLLQVQTPDNNYFAPENILQFACNFQDSGVGANQKSSAAQPEFDSDSYSSGASIPEYFWDCVHLRGLGKDVSYFGSATDPFGGVKYGGFTNLIATSIWQKGIWFGTGKNGASANMLNSDGLAGVPTIGTDGETPLHLVTMWFRDGINLDIDKFRFKTAFAGEIINGATYRVEVSTNLNPTDPFNAGTTWQNFNANSLEIPVGNERLIRYGTGASFAPNETPAKEQAARREVIQESGQIELGNCQVKGVKGIRILALASPVAQQGWWGEGRALLRDNNRTDGIQTFGWNVESDGSTTTGYGTTSEVWTRPQAAYYGKGSGDPKWNGNGQDGAGYNKDPSAITYAEGGDGNAYPTTAFVNAIENTVYSHSGTTTPTDSNDTTRAGYTQLCNMLGNFEITGVGKKALFVRVTKNQTTERDTQRKAYSPSYKKVASMGYKTSPIPLTDFSISEAQGLGQQFIDDKLRRYQARDYSLDGLSPFVNSNNLPVLGQTIAIADDTQGTPSAVSYSGIMTQYEFTMDANGTRFDFRLEDYDQLNTATYIQAS